MIFNCLHIHKYKLKEFTIQKIMNDKNMLIGQDAIELWECKICGKHKVRRIKI